jgi:dolichyl-phosphate beta-glucosyltransferase
MMDKISIVIPAYNEERRIGKTLRKISEYLDENRIAYELILVDDGSTDSTKEQVLDLDQKNTIILSNKRNMGKGYSVRKGILNAKYPYVLFTDSDLATPIEELERFGPNIDKGYDVIIGSRNLPKSRIENPQPFHRRIMGKIYSFIVSVIGVSGFRDTQCGFKLFRTDAAKDIVSRQTIAGFSFDVELLLIAKIRRHRIKEMPVIWNNNIESTLSPMKHSIQMLKDLIKIRINAISGRYRR